MPTITLNNGSPWADPTPTIDDLIALLAREPLDPTWENYGNFGDQCSLDWIEAWSDDATHGEAFRALSRDRGVAVHFFGNFWDYSHAFSIVSDDEDVIVRLVRAIRANQATIAYKQARDERKAQDDYWAVNERRKRKAARQPTRSRATRSR